MDESQSRGQKGLSLSPFVIEPSSRHTHSLILLHGLGSNGERFGKELLETGVCSNGRKLTDILPGARCIFPTLRRRRSTTLNQLRGLEESTREILELIDQESGKVPRGNIILGGLSQGCAMALVCLLAIDFSVGGFVGMSGWLPCRNEIEELVKADDKGDSEDDPFGSDDDVLSLHLVIMSVKRRIRRSES
ncbi:Uncharacterized protein TPAR_07310 [Tolypocladium paradoxum]|uniref:Phospholipase/carboxylesterase/thioesterase domain-containing protein n=1 Tax=Tolypocladium paradoxum TaxID=94208 RepID=A0A2S4KQL9_9HYPO|nr:Uncharacterized protein TPAR_07310 [Tolypocladium paradoxum]